MQHARDYIVRMGHVSYRQKTRYGHGPLVPTDGIVIGTCSSSFFTE